MLRSIGSLFDNSIKWEYIASSIKIYRVVYSILLERSDVFSEELKVFSEFEINDQNDVDSDDVFDNTSINEESWNFQNISISLIKVFKEVCNIDLFIVYFVD